MEGRSGDTEHRLTVLEEAVAGIRFDLELQRKAWVRRSEEFRRLELAVRDMTVHQDAAREAEATQYRRLELRIQWLMLVVGIASFMSPLTIALTVHR